MNIKAELLSDFSLTHCTKIVTYIGVDADLFDELMQCFLLDEYRLNQRASWVVNKVVEENSFLLEPYFEAIIRKLTSPEKPSHESVKRNSIRMFSLIQLPKKWEGEIYDLCYNVLENNKEPIATKVFAMETCYQVALHYPELRNEVKWAIEDNLLKFGDHSPAIWSRSRKLLGKLKK